jgi:DNA-binding CsgD family transcriptional regulator
MRKGTTDRQAQVVALREQGLSYAAIGEALGMNWRTAQTHVARYQAVNKAAELTLRESEVFDLFRIGLTMYEVGDRLGITFRTANQIKQHALAKYQARNMAHLVAIIADQTIAQLHNENADLKEQLSALRPEKVAEES